MKHRRFEQHSFKLNPAQKYILRELETLFKDNIEEDLRSTVNELVRTIKSIHNPTILRELKIIKDNGFTGQSLLSKLNYLYHQYDLKAQINSVSEPKNDLSISKIVCSSDLQDFSRD